MFQEEGSTSAREWTDKMQSQDRCVLICEFIIREEVLETLEVSRQQSHLEYYGVFKWLVLSVSCLEFLVSFI
jgi:hypothetical protein